MPLSGWAPSHQSALASLVLKWHRQQCLLKEPPKCPLTG